MLQEELLKTYNEVKDGIDKAVDDPTPFPIVKDEKISVVGDANETQIKSYDFKITFEFPKGTVEGRETENGVEKDIEYKNVFITPRRRPKTVSSMAKLYPFFQKISDKGGLEEFSPMEVAELLAENGEDFIDGAYDLVAKVLDVDPEIADFMKFESVMAATTQIFTSYPDLVNEAGNFFS